MVDIVQQVSTDIVLSDKSEAEAGTNNTKFMTPLRTKEAIDKNLVPFNAMSQSQFEAIRAANNEEFAASGFVHFGKHAVSATRSPINQGLWTIVDVANTMYMGRSGNYHVSSTSKTDGACVNIAGVLYQDMNTDTSHSNKQVVIKFPQAPDGKITYNKSTGEVVNHVDAAAAFIHADTSVDIEVVTDRVDMWGFESWLEEVNSTNPFVYHNGLIQSQATTMDGITTSASARPVTYYAVFDGDTGSKGKGVNFFTLTDAQKKKVLGNHKNNLYYLDDGRLVQWRLRQRAIASQRNGDWLNIDVTGKDAILFAANQYLNPQGAMTSNQTIGAFSKGFFVPPNDSGNRVSNGEIGHWTGMRGSLPAGSLGINDLCYFLVCGTVNRLNQGAYHPSLNPLGAKKWQRQDTSGAAFWYSGNVGSITSKSQAFIETVSVGTIGARSNTGAIGQDSGRPDGRSYDAIYADGFGGVCRDMRYSAYGVDSVDFAEADQRVKNGTYRGFEKGCFTKVYKGASQGRVNGIGLYHHDTLPSLSEMWLASDVIDMRAFASEGDTVYVLFNNELVTCTVFESRPTQVKLKYTGVVSFRIYSGADCSSASFISKIQLVSSVGGSFLQTDVIGNPVNILATPALANGWQGSWIPVIPDGTSKAFTFTRKISGSVYNRVATSDNGVSWGSASWAYDAPNNSATGAVGAGDVRVYYYQAFAKQTENAVNAVVYGGNAGVGSVIATSDSFLPEQNRGVLLKESLTSGKRGIGGYTNGAVQGLNLIQFALVSDKLLSNRSAYDSVHPPILIDGNTSADAVKALNYNVNINKQAFIQYAYTELKHSGTNWGDDSKITIVDNQATKTDLNGNTVLVGTAKLKEPIGWIKNKV